MGVTEVLRKLSEEVVEWCWLHTHTETIPRGSVTITALVPAFYDVSKPMFIQCDVLITGTLRGVTLSRRQTTNHWTEPFSRKPIHTSPERFQRMWLRLQNYVIFVEYRRGRNRHVPVWYPESSIYACMENEPVRLIDPSMDWTNQ